MNIPPETIEKINKSLSGMSVLKEIGYKTDTIQEKENVIRCYCPIHKETIFRSLALDDQNHTFKCAYTLCPGNKGGSFLQFYSMATNNNMETTIMFWAKQLHLEHELPQSEEWLRDLQQKAEDALQSKDYKSAITLFQKIIQFSPDKFDLQEKLANLYELNKDTKTASQQYIRMAEISAGKADLDQAESYLEKALKLTPDSEELCLELSDLYLKQDRISKAIPILQQWLIKTNIPDKKLDILNKLIKIEPTNVPWIQTRAELFEAMKNPEKALDDYQLLLKIHMESKSYPHAIQILEKLTVLQPENMDWPAQTALLQIQSKDFKNGYDRFIQTVDKLKTSKDYNTAIRFVNQAKKLITDNTDLEDLLINLLIDSGQIKDAVVLLERYADKENDARNVLKAISLYEKALSLIPEREDLSRKLIKCYSASGNNKKVLEISNQLAESFRDKREITQAIQIYKESLELSPDDNQTREKLATLYEENASIKDAIDQYLILIQKSLKNKQYDEAEAQCLHILSIDNEHIDTRLHLLDIYKETKQKVKEMDLRTQLANLYFRKHEIINARKMCQSILHISPNEITILQLLIQNETSPAKQAVYIKQMADHYYSQNNYDLAANQYRRLLQLLPENLYALKQLIGSLENLKAPKNEIKKLQLTTAEILFAGKKYPQALELYNQLRLLDPEDIETLEKVIQITKEIYRKSPKLLETKLVIEQLLSLAKLYDSRGNIEKTISLYEEIIKLDPDNMDIQFNLARIYQQMDKKEEAVQIYQSITLYFETKNQTKELIQAYLALLEIDDGNMEIRQKLAECYLTTGDEKSANQQFLLLAEYYENQNNHAKAQKIYTKLLKAFPENIDICIRLARNYNSDNHTEKALQILQSTAIKIQEKESTDDLLTIYSEILQIDPQNIPAHENLVKLFLSLERNQEALMEYDILASIYRQQGKLEQAIQTYLTALNMDPDNLQIRVVIAETYLEKGLKSEAQAQFSSITQSFIKENKLNEAVSLLQRILEIDPDHTKSQSLLADIYQQTGQPENAIPILIKLAVKSEKSHKMTEALDYWKKIHNIDSTRQDTLESIFNIYNQIGISNEAIPFILKLADNYRNSKNIKKSIELLEIAHTAETNNMEILKLLVQDYIQNGLSTKAVQILMQSANQLFESHKHQEALDILKQLVHIEPENLEAHYLTIKIYLDTNKDSEALNEYLLVTDILSAKNAYQQALKALEAALQLFPENIKVRKQYVELLEKTGDIDKAAIEYCNLGDSYIDGGKSDKGLVFYKQACNLKPKDLSLRKKTLELSKKVLPETDLIKEYLELSELFYHNGDTENGWKLCTEVYRMRPVDTSICSKLLLLTKQTEPDLKLIKYYSYLMDIFIKNKNYVEAIETGELSLDIDTTNPKILELLAKAYLETKSNKKAIQIYQTLADVYLEKEETKKVLDTYTMILSISPNDIKTRTSYIELYLQQGLEEELLDHYLKLGDAYLVSKMYDEALTILDKVMKFDPTNADAFHKIQLISNLQNRPNDMDDDLVLEKPSRKKETMRKPKTVTPVEFEENPEITEFLNTLEKNPDNLTIRRKLIQWYKIQGMMEEMITHLLSLADRQSRKGQYKEAMESIREILSVDPDHIQAKDTLEKLSRKIKSLDTLKTVISETKKKSPGANIIDDDKDVLFIKESKTHKKGNS